MKFVRTPINQPKTVADIELFPKTKNTCSMSWPTWDTDEGIPDLAPSHISVLLFRPRDMLEHYAEVLASGKDGEFLTLSDMICKAFDYTNEKALKELNKVFKFVKENYVTMEFIDPLRRFTTFVAYATPTSAEDIKQIYKELLKRVDLLAIPGTPTPSTATSQKAAISEEIPEVPESAEAAELPNCCYFAYLVPPEQGHEDEAVAGFLCYCAPEVDRAQQICMFKPNNGENKVCPFASPNPHAQGSEDACLCENITAQEEYTAYTEAVEVGTEEN